MADLVGRNALMAHHRLQGLLVHLGKWLVQIQLSCQGRQVSAKLLRCSTCRERHDLVDYRRSWIQLRGLIHVELLEEELLLIAELVRL